MPMPTTSCRAKGNSGETSRSVNALVAVECIESWAIDRLIPFVGNARTHTREQIAEIAASITEFGFVNPILVGTDGIIIAGHARLLAAKELGMSQVPVIVLHHLSEIQRRALVIADNQLALNAGWDEELLREQLAALRGEDFDLELIGFDEEELSRLLADRDTVVGLSDEDAVPAVTEALVSVPGDLWQLGDHLLLCGDATKAADLARTIDGWGGRRPDLHRPALQRGLPGLHATAAEHPGG